VVGVASPSSARVVLYQRCVVCGCELTSGNRSESPNLCFECLRGLER
jgi:hypothetical protein